MVNENGMVMMSEMEYKNLVGRTNKLEKEIDIAKMKLAIYHKAIFNMAKINLYGEVKKVNGLEIPADDFVKLMDDILDDSYNNENGFMKINETDLIIEWNGFITRIEHGCEIHNYILPAIKDAFEEINE